MSTENLFQYFQQELNQTQQLLAEFAEQHPKIASRLRISGSNIEDPQVARLTQAFALSNAKLRYKLEDDLPEVSHAVLDVLAPHFLAPIPSASIAQFQANAKQLQDKVLIPRGTALNVKTTNGELCHFQTCYPVEVYPIRLNSAQLMGSPLAGPKLVGRPTQAIKSVLQLHLTCNKTSQNWAAFELDVLRLHIQSTEPLAYPLYDLLMQQVEFIALTDSINDSAPLFLDKTCLQSVGFSEDENLLPYTAQVPAAHRLLTDYAILPEKFLFFEIKGLYKKLQEKFSQAGQSLYIWIYLKQSSKELEQAINAQYFEMGCTPIVNLFKKSAIPLRPQATQYDYPLSIEGYDSTRSYEVYSVESMVATKEGQPLLTIQPFNSIRHGSYTNDTVTYQTNRVPRWQLGVYDEHATEMLVTLTQELERWEIRSELLCTNCDLPSKISSATGQIELKFTGNKSEVIQSIKALIPFTPSFRPFQKPHACWRYLSHLSLHPLSLSSGSDGVAAFQDILGLYNMGGNSFFQEQISSISHITCQQKTARNPQGNHGNILWQGLEVVIEVDPSKFKSRSFWLFSTLLDHFLPLYATQNAFTQLTMTFKGSQDCQSWPLRSGTKPLL